MGRNDLLGRDLHFLRHRDEERLVGDYMVEHRLEKAWGVRDLTDRVRTQAREIEKPPETLFISDDAAENGDCGLSRLLLRRKLHGKSDSVCHSFMGIGLLCFLERENAGMTGSGWPAGKNGDRPMQKTVLIVEDNELNMKLFNDILEAHGYATLKTASGIEAMELARAHHPDLILMDIQLPEVSGLEVTKWLKEDDDLKDIPVVAVTAFAMKGDEERIREGGCEAYLSKPISVAKFLETVRTYADAG